MSEDLELLKLAARAAGAQPASFDGMRLGFFVDGVIRHWNPLTNDGDALWLAVRLKLDIYHDESRIAVFRQDLSCAFCEDSQEHDDHFAAARRAIVRAASAIARARSA